MSRMRKPSPTPDVTVSCIYCSRRRSISEVQADLDGPAFFAYFCEDTCMPQSDKPLDHLYEDRGWERTTEGWTAKHG